MNLPPSDLAPQKKLNAHRKRALLSFRRKTDLAWFLLTLMMFSAGVTAFVFVGLYLRERIVPAPAGGEKTTVVAIPQEEPSLVFQPSVPATPPDVPEPAPPEPPQVPPSKPDPSPEPKQELPPLLRSPEPKGRAFRIPQDGGPLKILVDRGAKLSASSTEAVGERAVRLNFDLSRGEWAQCFLEVKEDFKSFSRVQFLFMGDGSNNTLEFKVVDLDGTNVGVEWPQRTGKTGWTVVDLPLADLLYLYGGDPLLDWRRVRRISFAVSKRRGDQGGRGRVTIRGIKFS